MARPQVIRGLTNSIKQGNNLKRVQVFSPHNFKLTARHTSNRNILTKLIKKRKTNYFHTFVNKNRNEAKYMWKCIKINN